jgi:pimeloyl-ACP methyl ester carboxylesterase
MSAHLVGHSMGAWLAVGVAKYHPARLSSLVSQERDGVLQTTALAIEDGRIVGVYITRNPDKLSQLAKQLAISAPASPLH